MNTATHEPIKSVAEFLAHAETLERESVERYAELADSMEVHNNPKVTELFRKLSHFGENHLNKVLQQIAGLELPDIPPWDFKWNCPESPEAGCQDEVHYLMSIREALQFALHNEIRGRDFYAQVAETTPDPEVKAMAEEFTEEENEHVHLLEAWITNLTDPDAAPIEDPDPPNVLG
jgi:rubrerythrin